MAVKYAFLDGVDDKVNILASKPTDVSEIILDCVIEARVDWMQFINLGGKAINFMSNTMNVTYHADFKEVYVDGVLVTAGTPFIPINKRFVIRAILKDGINTGTAASYVFTNSNAQFVKGRIYDIKLYKVGILAAWYDMNTGTMNDQTGNGNHAQLVGGVWLEEAGGSVPVSGSSTFTSTSTLVSQGTVRVRSNATLDGTSSVVSSGSLRKRTSASLSGALGLVTKATVRKSGNVNLVGQAAFIAIGSSDTKVINGSVSFNATATVSGKGITKILGKVSLTGLATFTHIARQRLRASALITSKGALSSVATVGTLARVTLSGSAKLESRLVPANAAEVVRKVTLQAVVITNISLNVTIRNSITLEGDT